MASILFGESRKQTAKCGQHFIYRKSLTDAKCSSLLLCYINNQSETAHKLVINKLGSSCACCVITKRIELHCFIIDAASSTLFCQFLSDGILDEQINIFSRIFFGKKDENMMRTPLHVCISRICSLG